MRVSFELKTKKKKKLNENHFCRDFSVFFSFRSFSFHLHLPNLKTKIPLKISMQIIFRSLFVPTFCSYLMSQIGKIEEDERTKKKRKHNTQEETHQLPKHFFLVWKSRFEQLKLLYSTLIQMRMRMKNWIYTHKHTHTVSMSIARAQSDNCEPRFMLNKYW